MKNIYFIILSILIIIYIIYSVRKNNMSIKNSFGWMTASFVMLILSIFPYSLDWLAKFLGISYAPTLFFTLCIILLIIINFNASKRISSLREKVIDLAQEVSILKEKNEKK